MRFPASAYLKKGLSPQSDPEAIVRAVNACAEAGGGTVEIAQGVWHTPPLTLASGVHLHLQEGAVVEFIPDRQYYFPEVFVRWEGIECYSAHPLIYAKDARDITITGTGILRGNGTEWHRFGEKAEHRRRAEKLRQLVDQPVAKRILNREDDFLRPSFVHFVNCRDVLWENFTIEDAPMWTLHPVYCRNLAARNLTIHTQGPNTDGLDPDSCDGVVIENCSFTTGDDCIALKSGLNEDGWRVGTPCRNVRIRNCRMLTGHAGVAFGSELSGGIENVGIRHCEMRETGLGIRFKSLPGRGGFIRDVEVSDIEMHDLSGTALHFDMTYPQTTLPTTQTRGTTVENIHVDRIRCRNAAIGIFLRGNAAMPVKKLAFSHLDIEAECAIQREGDAVDCDFTDCNLTSGRSL